MGQLTDMMNAQMDNDQPAYPIPRGNPEHAAARAHFSSNRPPCMSCGQTRREPAPSSCLDPGNHPTGTERVVQSEQT